MKLRFMLLMILFLTWTVAGFAGSIEGKAAGGSVVYVDAVAGKTFPVPSQQPVINQKGLTFAPHLL